MKTQIINGKTHDEDEFTLVGKRELFDQLNEITEYPDSDYSFQMQIGNQIILSENIPEEMLRKDKWGDPVVKGERDKDVKFVLFYNPSEFLAYVKDEKALQAYGGQFLHDWRWEEL